MFRKLVLALALIAPINLYGASFDFTIDTSAVAGDTVRVAFDFTANTLNLNSLQLLTFSAPGATMGLPDTLGGLISGDLILGNNPAAFTLIQSEAFFNSLTVNLEPVGNLITFQTTLTENVGAGLPDQFSLFLLADDFLPLFPTTDPFGTDALFVADFGGPAQAFGPAVLNGTSVQVTVPGDDGPIIPEPSTFVLLGPGLLAFGLWHRRRRSELSRTGMEARNNRSAP